MEKRRNANIAAPLFTKSHFHTCIAAVHHYVVTRTNGFLRITVNPLNLSTVMPSLSKE